MKVVDRSTGAAITESYARKLEIVKRKLEAGSVIDRSDIIAAGITESGTRNTITKLKNCYDLDILTIQRSNILVGWILASEVL